MFQGKYKILFNKKVGADYFKMGILAPKIVQQARPGQFVHLRCQNNTEPLLRRPFSFHRLAENNLEIFYKVVGRGTNLLSKKKKADTIDVLGPLGNGFDLLRNTEYGIRNTILVAGGMGVAPLVSLAERLVYNLERRAHSRKIIVLLGARTKKEIHCARDFRKLGVKVQLATDDGSLGHKGFVTDLLKRFLRLSTINYPSFAKASEGRQLSTIYACGPEPMLAEVGQIAHRYRLPAQGSLEENMACGVGACLGCSIKTKSGNKLVCKDGPVFNLQEIKW